MSTFPDRDDAAAGGGDAQELAQLRLQIQAAHAELIRLRLMASPAAQRVDVGQAAQLLEANEQLVVSALQAREDADTAAHALSDASRSAGLDALTGLPNRVLMRDRLAQAISGASRHGSRLALLFVDLNNFKDINDSLGHAVGDQALRLVAHCLVSSIRAADTVSRHGGDEFLILLTEISGAEDADAIAEKVIVALGAPSRVGEHILRLTASIGISVYPDDGESVDALIERADAAMYRAKRSGLRSALHQGPELPTGRLRALSTFASLQRPFSHYELARAEHERRHAQLREANEQLVLAALSAQELQAAAEQALKRQTEFLALAAHELRNPLGPIRNAAALLGMNRADAKLLRRSLSIIDRQVTHISRLVGDLLDASRFNTGKLRLERRDVDLTSIVDAAIDTCRPAMDLRLQLFVVRVPPQALHVNADPARIEQVVTNLLDNASKYTPQNGEIDLSVETVEDAIVLTVTDNGIGIDPEALPNVFDLFMQEPHAIAFNGTGLGIGLAVVRELVEAHGGSVSAASAGRGLGSRFVVTLPQARPDVPVEG